jgi:ParB family transcriptional regulator, chromosome partitioning protein
MINPLLTLLSIAVGELMPDPTQPRKSFLKDEIDRLAASIAARGVLQPLRVRVRPDDDRKCWWIVTGECRWRAAKQAGLTHVPCIEVEGELSEADTLADQVIENSVRNSLKTLELARALSKLKALKGCTSQQLAAELGISGASLSRSEALLSLPDDIQAMVDDGRVPESTAYEISRLPDVAAQRELAQAVAAKQMSRDQVAEAVRGRVGQKNVRPKSSRLPLRLEGGISVTVSAGQPLTWEEFNAAMDKIRKEAKRLYENGKDIAELARLLRAS